MSCELTADVDSPCTLPFWSALPLTPGRPGARYKCVGVMPNTDMLKESPFAQKFGFRNSIEVNDYLQVTSGPLLLVSVFCS